MIKMIHKVHGVINVNSESEAAAHEQNGWEVEAKVKKQRKKRGPNKPKAQTNVDEQRDNQ